MDEDEIQKKIDELMISEGDKSFEIDEEYLFEQKEDFVRAMEGAGLSTELINAMESELKEVDSQRHNVIFVSTNGQNVVKAIHVPASALNNEDGPVVFPGAEKNVLIAAFSRDFIYKEVQRLEDVEDEDDRNDFWGEFLGELCHKIEMEIENKPVDWSEKI
jgi:hypothetical protein